MLRKEITPKSLGPGRFPWEPTCIPLHASSTLPPTLVRVKVLGRRREGVSNRRETLKLTVLSRLLLKVH